jgi:hypothetical protein
MFTSFALPIACQCLAGDAGNAGDRQNKGIP